MIDSSPSRGEAEDLSHPVYATHAEHTEALGDLKARLLADQKALDEKLLARIWRDRRQMLRAAHGHVCWSTPVPTARMRVPPKRYSDRCYL